METGKYSVILTDPAWQYKAHREATPGQRVAEAHYRTMPTDALARLPVSELAADNCALFMWATMPCLPEAFKLIQAWGFEYKTAAFTWIKLKQDGTPIGNGLGHYTRSNAELCLLAMRGMLPRKAHDVRSVIMARRREHSRKPDEQYERIMRLFDGPYLEMFARQCWPGWAVWGNQAGKFPAQPFLFSEQSA